MDKVELYKPTGRRDGLDRTIQARMSVEDVTKLNALCARVDISPSEMVRQLVNDEYERVFG